MVEAVCRSAHSNFGNSLVMEVWSRPAQHQPVTPLEDGIVRPAFRLFSAIPSGTQRSPESVLEPILDVLQRELSGVSLANLRSSVEIVVETRHYPERRRPILRPGLAAELQALQIGIEVEPVYQRPDPGQLYPAVLRVMEAGFSRALKRALFHFSKKYTSYRPKNFHALGRRAMVKAVWQADTRLDEVASGFDFVSEVNPINVEELWRTFRSARFETEPMLRYRPLSVDPSAGKRALYSIPLERVEDPSMAEVLREKQLELDRKLTMLGDRGAPAFLMGSQQLYGRVSPALLQTAERILEEIPAVASSKMRGRSLRPEEFMALVLSELEHYHKAWDEFDASVRINDDVLAGLMVSRGCLLVSAHSRIHSSRADALIQHEVGTHLLTYFNGKAQPLTQLRTGLAGYDEFQEGLAVVAEFLVGGLSPSRLRTLAARVIGADMVAKGATFIELYRLMCRYGFSRRPAFNLTLRLLRGGGLTKDLVYLRGLRSGSNC